MEKVRITRDDFLQDRQGEDVLADVVHDVEQPFGEVLGFFNDIDANGGWRNRNSTMIAHRWPVSCVSWNRSSRSTVPGRSARPTQRAPAPGDRRAGADHYGAAGWQKTGRKGSLGVRATATVRRPRQYGGPGVPVRTCRTI